MFKHILVGVDGEPGGRDAIALATNLRNPDSALTLAYIYREEPLAWRGAGEAYEAAERERGHGVLEAAREQAHVEAQLRTYASATVGRGLHELAQSLGADLLVIGSSRQGLLGRVFIGDATRAALNGAPCAVAIAPTAYARHPLALREIGVGYDGSPEAVHALGFARALADERRAKLSACEAISFPARLYAGPAYPDRETIKELLDAARARLARIGDVEPYAAYGEPAEELAMYSDALDLLVIGSRSYGPLGWLVHGSTAARLARTARCPLLVLTRAARDAPAARSSEDGHEAGSAPRAS